MTNLIAEAVSPLKDLAVNAAEAYAKETINNVLKHLEAEGWDVDKAAPRGNSLRDGRNEYITKTSKHNLYLSLTTYVKPSRSPKEPNLRQKSLAAEERFIKNAREDAAAQYDSYVLKLTSKIGKVQSAKLDGKYLWSRSFLTITKEDGTVEKWKTQCIINVSKLGRVFNQWPTRRMKS